MTMPNDRLFDGRPSEPLQSRVFSKNQEGGLFVEELPIYVPHPKVCHMAQYRCCKSRISCRLYPRCSQIGYQNTVCRQDCPNCTYEGCSLTPQQRQAEPVYVNHVIQTERLNLNLETRRRQEQQAHRKQHCKLWKFYNTLFGDLREKRNQRQRQRYWKDPEYYRMLSRKYCRKYRYKHRKPPTRCVNPKYLPECGLDCPNCPHEDCILPENWMEKASKERFRQNNPDYYARYYEAHRKEQLEQKKRYYAEHKDEILKKRQAYRQRPEVKARAAAYAQAYYAEHRDEILKQQQSYYQRPEVKARHAVHDRAYYAAHRDEINARRRQQRLEAKLQKGQSNIGKEAAP